MTSTIVAGVDMVKFVKPGEQEPYRAMASKAIQGAVKSAGIGPEDIQQAYASYVMGDSTCGQHALYDAFQTGIPVINVNNNCASGSSALFLARQAVLSGEVDCALAFGFEEMQPGSLGSSWDDREDPMSRFFDVLDKLDAPKGPAALRCFGAAGSHYMEKYGASSEIFAQISVKNRSHAIRNPYSLFNKPLTLEQVQSADVIWGDYLTLLMACPPSCGASAAIIVSSSFAKRHGISQGVEIVGQAMTTDTQNSWQNPMTNVGYDMSVRAAKQVYNQAGIGPESVDVIELHDCFATNEVITYEALGLCGEGEATEFIAQGNNTFGGKYVVNPSGGLMSKGHPIGATGLAQCFELYHQLQGSAGDRQVHDAQIALQHNLGLGGATVVTMYRKF